MHKPGADLADNLGSRYVGRHLPGLITIGMEKAVAASGVSDTEKIAPI
ncbi:MAG: hypothetical protein J2P54_14525 [Bradyrhizobiaceae bacterium]|nr:hypothetical protein [Bradyrhizobiaceae bacterium]